MLIKETLPKISIVTPSYNQGQFLEETILSVLQQGYPNLEYFIMDGGSTDGSLEIIQKYAPYLAYWESQPDHGQSHAINKGFKMATGELVAWLNSDDLYMPGVLFEVAKIWQEDQSMGFITGKTEFIEESGRGNKKLSGAKFNLLDSLLSSRNPVAQPSTFINRAILQKIAYLDESLHLSMDWDLWLRIACEYPTRFEPRAWSQTRHWHNSKTAMRLLDSGQEHVQIVRKLRSDQNCKVSKTTLRRALAAAYGRQAYLDYEGGNDAEFRKALTASLLLYPALKGGDASKLLPQAYPLLRLSRQMTQTLKKVCKFLRSQLS